MSSQQIFDHEIGFDPSNPAEALAQIPGSSAVAALFGHSSTDRPHLFRAANLKRRLERLLAPAAGQGKRLNLRDRIARIAWRETSSEFESLLLLYRGMALAFGLAEARKRMRLSPPFTVRYTVENRFPRIYATNHLRANALATTFGPFASKFAAERACEAMEEIFPIRRCHMELHPSPDDPGCIYGEIQKCLAPCQARCTDEQYGAEAAGALAFLRTHGASAREPVEAERDRASTDMRFEDASALHAKVQKLKSTAALIDDVVQPLADFRAALLVPCHASGVADSEASSVPAVALYVFANGRIHGPAPVSLLGVRLAKEQAQVGSSLFAQPLMLAPTPLSSEQASEATPAASPATAEERMAEALALLERGSTAEDAASLADALALLKRWYYRPEKQRTGALFLREHNAWPVRRMVRAGARIALG